MKYYDIKENRFKQLLVAIILVVTPLFSHAALMHYTFEGTVSGFDSRHSELDISNFDVVVGETSVKYVFEVDFDKNNSTYTNSSGTWNYFYTEYVSGSIINGIDRNLGYTGFNFFNSYGNVGQIIGSHYEAKISASANFTPDWMVQDWKVGESFRATDSGCFAGGASGCAVYAFSDVTLTSITPVPVPASFVLFISGLYGLRLVAKKA